MFDWCKKAATAAALLIRACHDQLAG